MPDWHDARLLERLVDRFAAPLWARSAVQVATMGEIGALTPEQKRDLLFIDLGTEISGGFLSEGRLHRGAQGIAGSIGHVYIGNAHAENLRLWQCPVACRPWPDARLSLRKDCAPRPMAEAACWPKRCAGPVS